MFRCFNFLIALTNERFLLFAVNTLNHDQPTRLNRMKDQLHRYPGLILIGIGLLLLGCGIYGLTQPDEFRARSRIKMPSLDYSGLADDLTGEQERAELVRKYCTEEIQLITSDAILSNVVSQLNLAAASNNLKELETPKTIRALRKQIHAKAVRNTLLVDIYVTDISADDAARIANLVAANYQQWCRAMTESLIKGGIKEIEDQLELQAQKVRTAEAKLNQLKADLNFPFPEPPEAEVQTNYRSIHDAKRLLNEEKDVQRLLIRKINIEKKDFSLNSSDVVEIVELATPPQSPLRRKKALSTILIAAGLLGCGWGIKIVRDSRSAASEV